MPPAKLFIISCAVSASLLVPACATTPDPAVVCSAEWVEPRADRAMAEFENNTKSVFKTLKKAGEKMKDGATPGPLQMMSVMSALSKLARQFENGQAVKDLRTLARTCDDPKLVKSAMTDLMRKKGMPDTFINFISQLDQFEKMLKSGELDAI